MRQFLERRGIGGGVGISCGLDFGGSLREQFHTTRRQSLMLPNHRAGFIMMPTIGQRSRTGALHYGEQATKYFNSGLLAARTTKHVRLVFSNNLPASTVCTFSADVTGDAMLQALQ